MGGVTLYSTTPTIQFEEPNGTHTLQEVGPLSGWHAGAYFGSITVHGGVHLHGSQLAASDLRNHIAEESGLAAPTEWSINVTSGRSTNSVGTTLSFSEPNGTYSFSVGTLDKSYASPGNPFGHRGEHL